MTAAPTPYRQRGPLYFAWRRFTANKAAVVSGLVLLILIVMAITAPLITKTGYDNQAYLTQALAFPSPEFWFGVDDLGRDFFTRIVYGAPCVESIKLFGSTCVRKVSNGYLAAPLPAPCQFAHRCRVHHSAMRYLCICAGQSTLGGYLPNFGAS